MGNVRWKKYRAFSGNHYNRVRKLFAKVKVISKCGNLKRKYWIKVNIYVFPRKFGDSFLKSYIPKLKSMVKENKKFDTQKGMASSLHRIMRMISKEKNPETFNEMMASAKVDTALDGAINDIVEKYIPKRTGDYHIHQLAPMVQLLPKSLNTDLFLEQKSLLFSLPS